MTAPDTADRIVRRLRIQGQVQGVWYRAWTVETATALGLDGWVRNLRDGSVEAVAAGPADAVAHLIFACHEGPPSAQVTRICLERAEDPGPTGFVKASSA